MYDNKFLTSRLAYSKTTDRSRSNARLTKVVSRHKSAQSAHWLILPARYLLIATTTVKSSYDNISIEDS